MVLSSTARRQHSNTRLQSRPLLPTSVARQSSTVPPPYAELPGLPTASTASHSSAPPSIWDNSASHATYSSYGDSMSSTDLVGTAHNGTGRNTTDCFVSAHLGTTEPSTM